METTILIKNKTKQTNFVSLLLHNELLKYFEYEGMFELCDVITKEVYYKVSLKENVQFPFGLTNTDVDFIGYLSSINIQDVPIRGKSVILNLTLKGWTKKDNKKELIISKYPFFTDDLIFTKRLFEKYYTE